MNAINYEEEALVDSEEVFEVIIKNNQTIW